MTLWQGGLFVAAVAVVGLFGLGTMLFLRRLFIARAGGTFEMALLLPKGWVLGFGRYDDDALEWYRLFSPLMRPSRSWPRDLLAINSQRRPSTAESEVLYPDQVVLECAAGKELLQVAMSTSALTGFSSWLEAGPPGADWDRPVR